MFKIVLFIRLAVPLCASAMAMAPRAAQPEPASEGAVTVVVEVALAPNSRPVDALAALGDMRAMMKMQPTERLRIMVP